MDIKKILGIIGLCGGISVPLSLQAMEYSPVEKSETASESLKYKDLKKLFKQEDFRKPQASENEISSALMYVKLLHLRRIDEQTVTGGGVLSGTITLQNVRDLAKSIRALSVAAYKQGGEYKESLELLLDYLSSQQLYTKFPVFKYSSYNDIRKVPADFLSAASVCNEVRREKLVEGVLTLLEWNIVRAGDAGTLAWLSSDYLYNAIPHVYNCILLNPNREKAIKEMDLFSHFISLSTSYTSGGNDILKPDGTGFHHKTHYNGYMYSYRTWVAYMHRLKGTSFRITEDAYLRMRKAVVSEYLMAVCSKNDKNRLYGNAMAGRHPFTGMEVTFSQKSFEQLIEVGGDIWGKEIDTDLAAYYNAFFQTDKYKGVAPAVLDGYYQFNYSPAGIYRKDNWVAVMRCPTTKFWGGEIYNKTNRFGRYQSHGTLEVIYEGGLVNTGYPADRDKQGAGWDWNMMPGSTTVHYGDWKQMTPNQNDKDRFDQWAKTTNFAGAVSGGDYGLFAAAFDQGDHWGGKRYEATNLTFCKSVLAVDGMLFSIGNGISSNGNYPEWITATNIFQTVVSGKYNTLVVDGKNIKKGNELRIDGTRSSWILSPVSTGFYVPEGHDDLVVKYDKQETPSSVGLAGKTDNELVAKAYLNHGVKPSQGKYQFLVVPAASVEKMEQIAHDFDKGGLFETVIMQDSLHVIKYHPTSLLAYSFFMPASKLTVGNVVSSETELLVLECVKDGKMSLSFCNPNLRPSKEVNKVWHSSDTHAVLELKGKWSVSKGMESVVTEFNDLGNTLLKATLKDGAKIDVELVPLK